MKRAVAILMALFMISTVCHAEEDKGLSKAITDVKSVIDVPGEFKDFEYSSSESDGEIEWSLHWSGDDGYLSVTVNSNGEILWYDLDEYKENTSEWGKTTKAEAREISDNFIKRVNPKLFEVLELSDIYSYGRHTEFVYDETRNGLKMNNRHTSVSVDRRGGKVVGYQTGGLSQKPVVSAENLISKDDAIKAYYEKMGIKLVYDKNYDYKNKTVSFTPMYTLKSGNLSAIDAKTGEKIEYKYYEGDDSETTFGAGNTAEKSADFSRSAEEASFTPEELVAIENVSEMIQKDEAEKIIKEAFGQIAEYKITGSHLSKNYYSDTFTYSLSFEGDNGFAYANINAKTGEILSYSNYRDDYTTDKEKANPNALQIADDFVKKYAAGRIAECAPAEADGGFVTYQRMANGAEVLGDFVKVRVNSKGEIESYSMTFTENATFPDISDRIGEFDAFKKLCEYGNFELIYVYNGEKYVPAYEIEKKYVCLDMKGEKIEEYEEIEPPAAYTDLSGHWSEKIVNTLLDNGYFLPNDSFEPDKPITIGEFLSFAKFAGGGYDTDYAKYLVRTVETDKSELDDIDLNKTLTRQIAAKYITYDLGCYDIASLPDIFIYPFTDAGTVEKTSIGHIAICKAKGIFAGDAEGRFNPDNEMTRAEAAAVIYNYYSKR